MAKENLIWYHLLMLAIVSIWGTTYISTSILLNGGTDSHIGGLEPMQICTIRSFIAYIGLLILSHKKFRSNSWKDELRFIGLGLSGVTLYFLCENTAVGITQVANVSLIISLAPLLTIILMALIYKIRIPLITITGVIIAFCGVACVILGNGQKWDVGPTAFVGDMLAGTSALLWAIYCVILKGMLEKYPKLYVTRKIFFYGLLSISTVLFISNDNPFPIDIISRPIIIGNLLYLGVLASLVCFLLYNVVISKIGVITTNNYGYLNPIITFVFAIIILNDPFSWTCLIGIIITLFGLWIAQIPEIRKLRKG